MNKKIKQTSQKKKMQKDQESNSTNNNENNSILLQLMEHENPGQRINISNYGPYNILQLLKTSVGEDQKYILGQINTNCSISPDTCELYVREGLIPLIVDLCLKEDSDLQTKMLCLMTLLAILNEFSSEQQKQQLFEDQIKQILRGMAKIARDELLKRNLDEDDKGQKYFKEQLKEIEQQKSNFEETMKNELWEGYKRMKQFEEEQKRKAFIDLIKKKEQNYTIEIEIGQLNETDQDQIIEFDQIQNINQQEEQRKNAIDEELKRKQQQEEEQRRKELEEEQKRKSLEEEQKRKAIEEEQKRKAQEELKRKSLEEDQKRKPIEEEQKRKAIEEEQKRKSLEEDQKRKALEEEQKRKALEEEQREFIRNNADLIQIAEILKQPLIESKQQQKQIQLQQEQELKKLINRLDDVEDDELRERIIKSGIADTLINIFLTLPLESITRPYSQLIYKLTSYPSSDEIKLQIFNKNPYPSILRLLEHQDTSIVKDIIYSLCYILEAGSNSVSSTSPHPHYQIIKECDGINKIFNIIRRNDVNFLIVLGAVQCINYIFQARNIQDDVNIKEIIFHFISSINNSANDIEKNYALDILNELTENKCILQEIMKYIDIEKIFRDLNKKIEGNEKEKKEIQNQQENDCYLLIMIIKLRYDDQIRKRIINSGIIDALLYIFKNNPLESITEPYSELFHQLTYPASDEIRLLLFNQQPYPSLLRLLEHQDDLIVWNAIISIYNILEAGSKSVSSTSPHPHYQIIKQYDGINKIFKMIKRNDLNNHEKSKGIECIGLIFKNHEIEDPQMKKEIIQYLISIITDPENNDNDKNKAQYALKRLALNKENLTGIMKQIDINKIFIDLNKQIKGNEKEKKDILKQQEQGCQLLIIILEDKEDNELRKRIINIGIAKSLLNFFLTQPNEIITKLFSNLFFQLTTPSSNEIQLLLFNLQPYPSLLKLLTHENINIINSAILSIHNILAGGLNSTSSQSQHPHYSILKEYDSIKKIFTLYKRNEIKQYSKLIAAQCISLIYRNQEIEDPQMKKEIIQYLISIIPDPENDEDYKNQAKYSLERFALNNENLIEIMKYIDIYKISKDLNKQIKGNEKEKKDILKQQEQGCQLLIIILEDKEDNELRKRIINIGIAKSLLNFFLTQPNEIITKLFSNLFFQLTTPSSNEIQLLLFNQQPYPSLLRLLKHKNENIIEDGIVSIHNILLAGSDSTSSQSQHPHYQSIKECDGISQIHTMFKRNDILKHTKRIAAECINHIYRNYEIEDPQMKTEIIQYLISIITDPKKDEQYKDDTKKALKRLSLNKANHDEIKRNEYKISDD